MNEAIEWQAENILDHHQSQSAKEQRNGPSIATERSAQPAPWSSLSESEGCSKAAGLVLLLGQRLRHVDNLHIQSRTNGMLPLQQCIEFV
jgi:hypothetical protein